DQKRRDVYARSPGTERARQVPIDVDRAPVPAVAGDVGNVVAVIDAAHALAQRLDDVVHHLVGYVFGALVRFGLPLHGPLFARSPVGLGRAAIGSDNANAPEPLHQGQAGR